MTRILLSYQNGKVHKYSPKQIYETLVNGRLPSFRLVVLSACHSQECARMFVKAGIPHVIAIDLWHTVLDEACHEFSNVFYEALLKGHTVEESFNSARTYVKNAVCGHVFWLMQM